MLEFIIIKDVGFAYMLHDWDVYLMEGPVARILLLYKELVTVLEITSE